MSVPSTNIEGGGGWTRLGWFEWVKRLVLGEERSPSEMKGHGEGSWAERRGCVNEKG